MGELATMDMDRKLGAIHLAPIFVPSGILIHAAVWPQQT